MQQRAELNIVQCILRLFNQVFDGRGLFHVGIRCFVVIGYDISFVVEVVIHAFRTVAKSGKHFIAVFRRYVFLIYAEQYAQFYIVDGIFGVFDKIADRYEFLVADRDYLRVVAIAVKFVIDTVRTVSERHVHSELAVFRFFTFVHAEQYAKLNFIKGVLRIFH